VGGGGVAAEKHYERKAFRLDAKKLGGVFRKGVVKKH